jgi:hypothetical protein
MGSSSNPRGPTPPSALPPIWSILWCSFCEAVRNEVNCHAAGLLSERDVRALPNWTRVEITWNGGNGPHPYDVVQLHGWPYAILARDNPWRDPDADDAVAAGRVPRCAFGMEIEFVARYATRVRLPSSDPWPPP